MHCAGGPSLPPPAAAGGWLTSRHLPLSWPGSFHCLWLGLKLNLEKCVILHKAVVPGPGGSPPQRAGGGISKATFRSARPGLQLAFHMVEHALLFQPLPHHPDTLVYY